jgi:hypothetical protein
MVPTVMAAAVVVVALAVVIDATTAALGPLRRVKVPLP